MNYEEIEEIVKNTLSEKRFNHSKGVAKRAAELASMYGEDMETARKIGIAHDIAKEMPKGEALKYARENGIMFDEIEQNEKGLWHSKLGAAIAVEKFGFTEDMAEAITYHTTGNINMNTMDPLCQVNDTKFSNIFLQHEVIRQFKEMSNFSHINEPIVILV